jgi:predicted AlkP superfamily phosphohydrolase/phosphomutase
VEAMRPERPAHVAVIALDGASLDLITSAAAEGRLPNFGRILDAGAVGHLATLHPTSPEAVWAAVATGKLPQKNGVRSAAIYQVAEGGGSLQLLPDYCFAHGLERFGFLVEQPHTSATFRARTLWSILSVNGFSVGVVGWPLTQPAPVVRGYVVSDDYHRVALTPSGIDNPSALYPPELQLEVQTALENAMADPPAVVMASLGGGLDPRHETPARTDRIYDRIARTLAAARPAQVTLTRYQSLDPIGHYFLRYAAPSEFGDVTDEERRRFGPVLERHYALVDEAIGRAMAALGPEDLLLVVSGYGMEPLGLGKRLVERVIGDPQISGTHEAAPDGFLMAYGASVTRGRRQARGSVVDVTPTILYFLGLPIGRDMDGYARTDLFLPSFTSERPLTFIPTYDR